MGRKWARQIRGRSRRRLDIRRIARPNSNAAPPREPQLESLKRAFENEKFPIERLQNWGKFPSFASRIFFRARSNHHFRSSASNTIRAHLWTHFALNFRKSEPQEFKRVVRRRIKVRWKVAILAHPTVSLTSKSNHLSRSSHG